MKCPHLLVGEGEHYYILTLDEARAVAKTGLAQQPFDLKQYSLPLTERDRIGLPWKSVLAIRVCGARAKNGSFWELVLELLKDYEA